MVDGNSVLILCSNNYLGLTTHPRLKKAAIDAINLYGVGSGSVRTIAGNMDIHEKLEHKISTYKRCESALIFPTGFAANSGSIPQLTNENDVIISDELNHGSIIDGVKLSKAEKRVFKHGDSDDLSKIMDTSDEWIRTRTGIHERRWSDKQTGASDLAYEASINAILNAGIDASEIDLVVVGLSLIHI